MFTGKGSLPGSGQISEGVQSQARPRTENLWLKLDRLRLSVKSARNEEDFKAINVDSLQVGWVLFCNEGSVIDLLL